MTARYDCIVLGLGGFGSAALFHAAARGLSVLGLEQFSIAHDRGSSHGETRIIRKAYFEHPDYVPLLLRAYELWRELEVDQERVLMHLCGLLLAGPPSGQTIAGAKLAAQIHGVPLIDVSVRQAEPRFSGFRFPEGFAAAFEPEAGFLEVENCVRAHIQAAVRRGAVLATNEVVQEWAAVGNAIRVRTSTGKYEAASLIVTAGAWSSRILNALALPLEVVRKPLFWFPTRSSAYAIGSGAPTFYFEMPFGDFYGFPSTDQETVKAAEHSGGEHVADPHTVDRSLRRRDWEPLARFLKQCLPNVDAEPVRHDVCMYTRTPDRHFVVDRHPEHANVAFGAGFSGHGFKFTPVIGEVLIDLVTQGSTRQPVGFLSVDRKGLERSLGHRSGENRENG